MIQHPLISLTEDKTLLGSIAEEYGTPLYIYSGNRIKNNIDRLSTALNNHLKKNGFANIGDHTPLPPIDFGVSPN